MPEEYTTLYRAFRPHRFCDVVGQGPIVQTLKNQVKSGRIAHAYLFNGTRGTGKTTTARILARAINCENPQDGEPCGVCPTCQALSQENNLDILEIDAASNGSVDQVRDLCAKVAYPPQACRYRVIIIDEVHSLSTSAASFNALLKTLEEPPEHAVFILATTDPQKLPPTILSRCQRYDFKRIGTKDIAAISLTREMVYIANIVKCRPPGNREPTPEEAAACLPYLRAQFVLIRPKILVCLGRTAAMHILRPDIRITRERGIWVEKKGTLILPTYHPSALLRDETGQKKREAWQDLKSLREKMREMDLYPKEEKTWTQ